MEQIAPDLWKLNVYPANAINLYLAGDTLIDAGFPRATKAICKRLRGHTVRAHALTHAHPDHMGSSRKVCEALKLPFLCGENEVPAAEHGDMRRQAPDPEHWWLGGQHFFMPIAGHPVSRALREGDETGGFTVLDAPGHTPGHIAFWRERDRVLVLGDVVTNVNMTTMREELHWPIRLFTHSHKTNRESARKLAALKPRIVCFGHGPVLRDGARFTEYAS